MTYKSRTRWIDSASRLAVILNLTDSELELLSGLGPQNEEAGESRLRQLHVVGRAIAALELEKLELARQLRRGNVSDVCIADELGVSKQAVGQWLGPRAGWGLSNGAPEESHGLRFGDGA